MSGFNIFGGLFFGTVGFAAFLIGKKQADWKKLTIGISLMAYTYFFQSTAAIYAIGSVLTVLLFIFRD